MIYKVLFKIYYMSIKDAFKTLVCENNIWNIVNIL